MTSQTKCFLSFGEMNPFVFAVLAASVSEAKRTVARCAMELAGLRDLRARRPSQASSRGAMRSIASRRAVRGDQRLRCGSGALRQARGSFRGRPAALQNGLGNSKARKKLRRSALKSLK